MFSFNIFKSNVNNTHFNKLFSTFVFLLDEIEMDPTFFFVEMFFHA